MLDKTSVSLPYCTVEHQPQNTPQTQPKVVSGRNLAHAKRSVAAKMLLAADLHTDRVRLVSPTLGQCAGLIGLCIPYVRAGVSIVDDLAARNAVLAGVSIRDIVVGTKSESLADHMRRSSRGELLNAARAVGVTAVWDCMVEPLI
jgi:hypothetical protein